MMIYRTHVEISIFIVVIFIIFMFMLISILNSMKMAKIRKIFDFVKTLMLLRGFFITKIRAFCEEIEHLLLSMVVF